MEILATGFGGFIDGFNLYVKMFNIVVIVGYGAFATAMLGMNGFGMGDMEKQKQRKKIVVSSGIYAALSLIVFDLVFGFISMTNLDDAADSSNDKVTNFLEQQAEEIEQGNYKSKLGDDSNGSYGDSDGGDDLNF